MRNFATLKEMVYKHIQKRIITGEFKPGERLREDEICKSLKTSRTPAREAFIKLEAEGFLIGLPHRGYIIKKLTLKEIKDIFITLGCLEGYAAKEATSKMAEKDIHLLKENLSKMKQLLNQRKYNLYNKYHLSFHNVFINASENNVLIETISLLKKRIYEHPKNLKVHTPEWFEKTIKEHEHMMSLFEKRDAEKIENYIRKVHWNVEESLPFIKKTFPFANADINYANLQNL